jgi:hypothetical protein
MEIEANAYGILGLLIRERKFDFHLTRRLGIEYIICVYRYAITYKCHIKLFDDLILCMFCLVCRHSMNSCIALYSTMPNFIK